MDSGSKIIVAMMRLPFQKETNTKMKEKSARINSDRGYGVVVSAVRSLRRRGFNCMWVGSWYDKGEAENKKLSENLGPNYVPIFLPAQLEDNYYAGFCKQVLWPLLHYQMIQSSFNVKQWNAYVLANEIYADAITKVYQKGDLIFIQDYHLMLLPKLLRERIPDAKIGFFLHTPFPTSELYRTLAPRTDILKGLLGANLLGFQTWDYSRHFFSTLTRILGLEFNHRGVPDYADHEGAPERTIHVTIAPTGINAAVFLETLDTHEGKEEVKKLRSGFKDLKVIVGRDPIDNTKGIIEKLLAFEQFLIAYPEWQGKVVLVQNCLLSANVVNDDDYHDVNTEQLSSQINEHVGRINGLFSVADYTPIHYSTTELTWPELCALYHIADVCLVTPLRDGLNLTSHEYIVCQNNKSNGPGVLILSEFAGSSQSLSGAVRINPWNSEQMVQAINSALLMSQQERSIKHEHNFNYVTSNTSEVWAKAFLDELIAGESAADATDALHKAPKKIDMDVLQHKYRNSKNRVFFLDYDGTLVAIAAKPHLATPTDKMLDIIRKLASDEKNTVYIVSGRDRESLDRFVGALPVGFSAEHGCFIRPPPDRATGEEKEWENIVAGWDQSWKDTIYSIFKDYQERTPGSMVERKNVNITWHYRNSDPDYGSWMSRELLTHLRDTVSAKFPVDVLVGKKAIEVRPKGVSKGTALKRILATDAANDPYDFILCLGDDKTDEDMFTALQENHEERTYSDSTFTGIVGKKPSEAQYYLDGQPQVLTVLETLAKTEVNES